MVPFDVLVRFLPREPHKGEFVKALLINAQYPLVCASVAILSRIQVSPYMELCSGKCWPVSYIARPKSNGRTVGGLISSIQEYSRVLKFPRVFNSIH